MTALETRYALLLIAEESYGAPDRLRRLAARAEEDARAASEVRATDEPVRR